MRRIHRWRRCRDGGDCFSGYIGRRFTFTSRRSVAPIRPDGHECPKSAPEHTVIYERSSPCEHTWTLLRRSTRRETAYCLGQRPVAGRDKRTGATSNFILVLLFIEHTTLRLPLSRLRTPPSPIDRTDAGLVTKIRRPLTISLSRPTPSHLVSLASVKLILAPPTSSLGLAASLSSRLPRLPGQ